MIAVELEEKKKRIRFSTKGDVKSSNIKEFNSEFTTLMSSFRSAKWKDFVFGFAQCTHLGFGCFKLDFFS
ncbi:MAG: hypothetical protein LR015_09280 [Verrucomicrobia bacterium]|nr:hypothetical protein [Verrucomicrobiota bacterium]